MNTTALQPLLSHYDLKRPINWGGIFKRRADLIVEIGFGLGEILTQRALDNPDKDFVGIENNWERIYKTLKRIEREGRGQIKNIRILRLDATVAFERLFNQKSIDHIYCLFPCPWPKKKHTKHRLFSNQSLKLINSRLKKKAHLNVVTDYFPYSEWIESESYDSGFTFDSKPVGSRYNTKFEKKWREEGQDKFFELNLIKNNHVNINVKKDIRLKTYSVKSFDPSRFRFVDSKGDATLIFKGMNFDKDKNEALLHTLIAEEHLTQNFWVSISKRDEKWLIKKADGHYFFPTPGIANALKLIYLCAKEA